jgi:hypothetical protein
MVKEFVFQKKINFQFFKKVFFFTALKQKGFWIFILYKMNSLLMLVWMINFIALQKYNGKTWFFLQVIHIHNVLAIF